MRVLFVIRCPKTGEEVPTGTTVEIELVHTLPKDKMPLLCPACGEEHEWSAEDALLAHANSGLDDAAAEGVVTAKAGLLPMGEADR
jgi:hypothetical protein